MSYIFNKTLQTLLFFFIFINPSISDEKIAFVDIDYIIQNSNVGKKMISNINKLDNADAIIVLSGMTKTLKTNDGYKYEFKGDVDRFIAGISLIKNNKAPLIVFTRGTLPWSSGIPEGEHLKELAIKFGVSEVYIGLGYKKNVIINYFKKNSVSFLRQNQNLTIANINFNKRLIRVNLVDTGIKTMTGGRVKKLLKYFKDENFYLTYGDGLANVNLKKLLSFHNKNKAIMTLTAVHPPARFGYVKINNNRVNEYIMSLEPDRLTFVMKYYL